LDTDDSEADENDNGKEDEDNNAPYALLDDLDEGNAHVMGLSALVKTDPELYKKTTRNCSSSIQAVPMKIRIMTKTKRWTRTMKKKQRRHLC
jgi:nucleolar complex protein 2